jgi:hypothetical protein
MEAKHTPEPWNISKTMMPEDCRGDWRIADQYDNDLADVFCEATSENGYTDETNAANAERIVACVNGCRGIDPAAVRDMLNALREGVCQYTLLQEADLLGTGDVEALDMMRAALAKAEGR